MSSQHQKSGNRRVAVLAASFAAVTLALAGCSASNTTTASSYGFSSAKQTSKQITVWVDNTRVAAADAYNKANPKDAVKVVTYDGNTSGDLQTKINLYDKAGSGWPDVVFSGQTNDSTWAAQKDAGVQPFAAPLNKGLIDKSVLSGFTAGAFDPCTVNGTIYCMRNDLAPNVLWYNSSLLKQFGYSVPTTWEEYQTIGEDLAAKHPGYIVGSVGDSYTPVQVFLWGSKCGANQVTGARAVTIDVKSADCTRATKLMDTLVADGSLTQDSVFSPAFVQKFTGKVVMIPGPAWLGGSLFSSASSLNVPSGQMGIGAPLSWGSDKAVTGNVGGGTWYVSSHSSNLAAAKKFVTWVTTDPAYQVNLAPGLPADAKAQAAWVTKQSTSGYYTTGLSPLTNASSEVWSGWGDPKYSAADAWAKVVMPGVANGQKSTDLLDAFATQLKNQAQVDGYTVTVK